MSPAAPLIATVAIVLAIVVALGGLALLAGTPLRRRWAGRERRAFDRALAALLELSGGDEPDTDRIAGIVRSSPDRVADRAVVTAGRWLGGRDRLRLADAARAAGVEGRAVKALRSRRWSRRLRGVRVLAAVSSDLPDRSLFRDRHPEVRAAALLWARDVPEEPDDGSWTSMRTPTRTGGAITDGLVDPSSLVRLAAKHAVVSLETPPVTAVEAALRGSLDPQHLEAAPLGPLAPLAAVAALGRAAASIDLHAPLGSDDARVRAAAVRALAASRPEEFAARVDVAGRDELPVRLAVAQVADRSLTSVHVLVTLAADPAWQVRQAARATLGRTGATGRALLRRVQWGTS